MKKVLLLLIALFVFCPGQVNASNFDKYSEDNKIVSALNVLEKINARDVFARLDKSSTKIIFYDFTLISFSYTHDFAMASTDEHGDNYILINDKFMNSPPEAIACLIAHESVHQLPKATFEEEVRATVTEARTWLKVMKMKNFDKNDKLVQREHKLAMLYRASGSNHKLIRKYIANNEFYQEQLAMH